MKKLATVLLAVVLSGCASAPEIKNPDDYYFTAVVDYSLVWEDALAVGNYNNVDGTVLGAVYAVRPATGQVKTYFAYVAFRGRNLTAKKIIRFLNSKNCRPANLQELMAFAAAYPDEQRTGPIAALGVTYRGGVAYLSGNSQERNLSFSLLGGRANHVWESGARFLMVYEPPK